MDILERDKMLMEIARNAEPIFQENSWEYRGKVPSAFDIFANLDRLCNVLSENPDSEIACGRFTVFFKDDKLTVIPHFEIGG